MALLVSGGSIGVEEGGAPFHWFRRAVKRRGERYGWGVPPLTGWGLGDLPREDFQKNKAQMVKFGGITMLGITLEPLGRFWQTRPCWKALEEHYNLVWVLREGGARAPDAPPLNPPLTDLAVSWSFSFSLQEIWNVSANVCALCNTPGFSGRGRYFLLAKVPDRIGRIGIFSQKVWHWTYLEVSQSVDQWICLLFGFTVYLATLNNLLLTGYQGPLASYQKYLALCQ